MVYKGKIVRNKVIVHIYEGEVLCMLPDGVVLSAGSVKGIERKIRTWIKKNVKSDETWLTTIDYVKQ